MVLLVFAAVLFILRSVYCRRFVFLMGPVRHCDHTSLGKRVKAGGWAEGGGGGL